MKTNKSLARIVLEPLAFAVVAAICVRALVHAYSIPSPSMEPTLLSGDHILVTRYLPLIGAPSRGDVAVFRLDGDELVVKRVVAVPGDRVEIRGTDLVVNGKTLDEQYLVSRIDNGSLPSFVVPAGRYFLLGDNREHSLDSRAFGTVARDALVGKARLIFWSSTGPLSFDGNSAMAFSNTTSTPSPGVHRIRWSRLLHFIR